MVQKISQSALCIIVILAGTFSIVQCHLFLRRNDSEIATCGQFHVCNIIYDRYWMTDQVDKRCKCPDETFCPAIYTPTDGWGLAVNARTQMKFCSPMSNITTYLNPCNGDDVAITVKTLYHMDSITNLTVELHCSCPTKEPIYWKYHSRVGETIDEDLNLFQITDNYRCVGLKKCETNEFCGFARLDFGFVFQRCSCDSYSHCHYSVQDNDIVEDVEELFYNGLVFRAKCIPTDNSNW